jgi:hypothetical protein
MELLETVYPPPLCCPCPCPGGELGAGGGVAVGVVEPPKVGVRALVGVGVLC